jgi:hypothetical protein
MSKIITHTSPDWDAIGSAWLLQRHDSHYEHTEIVCASREQIEEYKDTHAAIVDCGGTLDPLGRRFDHHQMPEGAANETCAALLVWEWLGGKSGSVAHLEPLIMLIWAGDTGRSTNGADTSREVGLHAQLSARKSAGWTDAALMEWGCQELDLLAARLKRQTEAAAELNEKLVWKSNDGKVVAIEHGQPRHSQAAFAAGATLVVFRSDIPTENGTSYAIGIQRNQAAEFPHVGSVLADSEIDFATEADDWFRHPAGFFAGRGTGKATRFDPVPDGLAVGAVARVIDAAWER